MEGNGEGGIRTHGTVTRTMAFEFEDSRAGVGRPAAKRASGLTDAIVVNRGLIPAIFLKRESPQACPADSEDSP
jgi:hypothetical protein